MLTGPDTSDNSIIPFGKHLFLFLKNNDPMITVDIQKLSSQFALQARDFVAAPSLMKGLNLDDVSMKLMQAATGILKDNQLMGDLHQFRQACREQDTDRLAGLLDRICDRLEAHQIDI